MNKTNFHITDMSRRVSYGGSFDSLKSAIESAEKRPSGYSSYIIGDNNGRAFNLDGERIYI